jgi:hypothetical protein
VATTKALELAQLADSITVNANGEISNIGTLSSLDVTDRVSAAELRVTNIVTDTLVKFDGSILNDSSITDNGTTVDITLSTTSSNTSTGALTVTGGIGTEENVNAGRLFARGVASSQANPFTVFGTLGNVGVNYEGVDLFFTRPSASYFSANDAAGHFWFRTGGTNRRLLIEADGDIRFTQSANTSLYGFEYTASTSNVDIAGKVTATRFEPNGNVDITAVGLSTYASGAWLNTPTGTSGYLGHAGSGILKWDSDSVDVTGDLTVSGDLIISGNTATVNTNDLLIEDLNITLANGAANSAVADGAGITIDGANARITYTSTNDRFELNKDLQVTSQVTIVGDTASAGGTETLILANGSGSTQLQFGTKENDYAWMQVDDAGTKRALLLQAEGGDVTLGGAGSPSNLTVRGDIQIDAANTETRSLTIGQGRAGDGYSYIDLVGDATNTDYGLRLIRGNTGANTYSDVQHLGTGALRLRALTTGSNIEFRTTLTGQTPGNDNVKMSISSDGMVRQYSNQSSGPDWQINNTYANNAIRFEGSTNASIYLDGNDGDFAGADYGRIYHDGSSLYFGTHGANNLRLTQDYFMWNTNTNATPFYIGRSGGTSQSLRIMVDDASVNFYSIQDEVDTGNFKFFLGTNADQNTGFSVYGEGSVTSLLDVRADGTTNIRGNTTVQNSDLTVDNSIRTNQVRHSVRPTLLLDFANSKRLDSRIEFTRSTSAKYWDGKTTSKANQNYLRDTQDYSSGVWAPDGSSITSTTIDDPYGGNTAARVTADGTNGYHGIHQNYQLPFDDLVTFSAYVRQGTSTGYLQMLTGGSAQPWATFNLTNGTVGNGGGAAASRIVQIGSGGWYRISITVAAADAPAASGWYIWEMPASNSSRAVQHTSSGYFDTWGWQLEEKANPPTEFLPTTNAPLTKYQPTLVSAAANVPRFDHDPLTSKSKGLLIEEGHVNLIEYSESIVNWTQMGNARLLSDVGISPDGTQTSDLLYITSGANAQNRFSFDGQVVLSADTYTFSVYMKSAGLQYTALTIYDGTAYQGRAVFDLVNGTIASNNNGDALIENVGNGWYRCILTATITQDLPDGNRASGIWPRYTIGDGAGAEPGDATREAQGILVWGGQLEQGIFATSYIQTTGSQGTRASDNATMTYSNLTDWYRFDEGTIFAEYSNEYLRTTDQYVLSIQNYARNVEAVHFRSYNTVDAVQAYNDSATQGTFTRAISAGVDNKVALAYSDISSSYCLNGGSVSTDSYWVMPTQVWRMEIGRATTSSSTLYRNGHIKKIAYYNERLLDAEIQALTEND